MRVATVLTGSIVAVIALAMNLLREQHILKKKLKKIEMEIQKALTERQAERKGRIRAQQELRAALMSSNDDNSHGVPSTSFPMTPIGFLKSCFTTRNGTPRQPLLVPLSRSQLDLPIDGVPPSVFDGLYDFSHCWLIYIFHLNTDLPRLWKASPHKDFRAKVRVPRLDGERKGVFATRSPHRPLPIGLSVAKIEKIIGRTLYLSGADIVDGTPILDVKPYLPFSDSLQNAKFPDWIKTRGENDPLFIKSVEFSSDFESQLKICWQKWEKYSLYSSDSEFKSAIFQVLSTDIRSVHQRNGQTLVTVSHGEETNNLEQSRVSDPISEDESKISVKNDETEYSLIFEKLEIKYKIDFDQNLFVNSISNYQSETLT